MVQTVEFTFGISYAIYYYQESTQATEIHIIYYKAMAKIPV